MGHFSTSWSSQLLCTQMVGLDPYPLCHAAFSEILAVRLGRRLFSLPDILITYSLTTPPCPCVFNLIDLKVRTHFICLQELFHLNEVLFFSLIVQSSGHLALVHFCLQVQEKTQLQEKCKSQFLTF